MDYLTHAQTALLKLILPVLHLSTGFELVPQADMQNLFNLTYTQPVSLQISLLAGSRTNKQIKKSTVLPSASFYLEKYGLRLTKNPEVAQPIKNQMK